MSKYKDFLKELAEARSRETYVRLTSFDLNDYPQETLEGMVTGGSVNIDGNSAVRRTCSLTLAVVDPEAAINKENWALKNRFKVELGLKNEINPDYPPIIWFNQGIYVISSFSLSETLSNRTVSIQGKDKMCLLNGEVSGHLAMKTDFGVIEEFDAKTNIVTKTKLTIKEIITNAVKEYSHERMENIVINDLDTFGYELWEYRGDSPLFLIVSISNGYPIVYNMTLNKNMEVYVGDDTCKISEIPKYYSMNSLDVQYNDGYTEIALTTGNDADKYAVIKIEYGETAGYHQTPLVYNTDLVLTAGSTVSQLLDKLKQMLGNFEYFYDLNGRFVFQKKNNYIQELFSPINGDMIQPTMVASPYDYEFEDSSLFTNLPTSSNINNIKNDFTVWGSRKGANNTSLPIHVRYAIQKKPTSYKSREKTYNSFYSATQAGYAELFSYTIVDLEGEEKKLSKMEVKDKIDWLKTYLKAKYFDKEANWYYFIEEPINMDEYLDWFNKNTESLEDRIIENHYGDYEIFLKKNLYLNKELLEKNLEVLETYYNTGVSQKNTPRLKEKFVVPSFTFVAQKEENKRSYWYYGEQMSKDDMEKIREELIAIEAKGFYEESYDYNGDGKVDTVDLAILKLYISTGNPDGYEAFSGGVKIPCDWREIIYQMALDFYKYGQDSDFYIQLEKDNPEEYKLGKTGYEQYYSEFQGFWRQLYHPCPTEEDKKQYDYYDVDGSDGNGHRAYWNKAIHKDPNSLNFWFDFYDIQDSELSNYSVDKIGIHTKVENANNVSSIYFNNTPEALFIVKPNEQGNGEMAYTEIQIQESTQNLFYRSSQGKGAIDRVNELFYNHTCLPETLTITSVPIYQLQPNSRIKLKGKGDYTIDKLTYNLTHNGTMSLTCTKIIEQIY